MKIRAITMFIPLNWPFNMTAIASAGRFLQYARQQFEKAGYEVQTLRLATPPFMDLLGNPQPQITEEFAFLLESKAKQYSIDFVSMGPVMAATPHSLLSPIEIIPGIIAQTDSLFTTVLAASTETGINLAAIEATAQAIYDIGQTTPNGFGNLRFAMLANVKAGGPFFPGAYHYSPDPAFGLATEAADLAVDAFQNAHTLDQARKNLVSAINHHGHQLHEVVSHLVDEHNIRYTGIDFSLAPYPSDQKSIGAAMEHLGVDTFGGHGTLFATAFLTRCIKQADIPHTGYCGVMLPVLEDTILARRAASGHFTVNDLLLYSSVCGTGLDTIPLPGDTTPRQIAGILLDVATLSVTLDKPLTARLLPIPGLKTGDATTFDFEYFANSAAMPVKNNGSSAIFSNNTFFNFSAE